MKMLGKNKYKIIFVVMLLVVMGYFYSSQQNIVTAGENNAPQALPVKIEQVKREKTRVWFQYSGKAKAVNYAEIKPRVTGAITEIRFNEGGRVAAGDVLFVIDPAPYKARLDASKADLDSAKTQVTLTKKEYNRAKELIASDAISRKILDERSNAYTMAKANKKSAEARVNQAQIDLDYAYVKAPFSGKASRAEITVGNIVGAGLSAPTLTTIVSDDEIYIDFEIDEKIYFEHIKNAMDKGQEVPVKVSASNADGSEIHGKILNLDNKIDVNSGTIRARALLKNGNMALLPGMFVSVEVSSGEEEKILISEKAIGTDQNRKFVWVVNADSKTEYRQIDIGDTVAGKRVVISGLSEGDRVVTEGVIKIRPDTLVVEKSSMKVAKDSLSKAGK